MIVMEKRTELDWIKRRVNNAMENNITTNLESRLMTVRLRVNKSAENGAKMELDPC